MKILYFTMEYPRATDTFIQREVEALRSQGLTVHTVAARRPGEEHMVGDEQRRERARTNYLLAGRMAGAVPAMIGAQLKLMTRRPRSWLAAARLAWDTSRPGVRGRLYQLAYFLEAGLLAEQAIEHDAEHLHAHFGDVATSVTMLAAELTGRPFSFTLHGPGVFFDANVWELGTKIERSRFVSCISWFCRSQAQLLSSEEAATKLHIVHCGIDLDRYEMRSHVADDQTSGVGADPAQIAFVARLDHVKGLTVLLEAIAEVNNRLQQADHPGVRLDIVGDGPNRKAFEASARKLGVADWVRFLGYQNQSEVAAVLARSDMFVLPSFAEGVPVSLMEASASGLPVIATNVGGVTELVADGVTGFVVPPGDVAALAERISTLATNPALRSQMGAAGRRRVATDFNSATEAGRLGLLFTSSSSPTAVGRPIRPPVSEIGP